MQEIVFNKNEVEQLIVFYNQLYQNGIKEFDVDLLKKLIVMGDNLKLNTDNLKLMLKEGENDKKQ